MKVLNFEFVIAILALLVSIFAIIFSWLARMKSVAVATDDFVLKHRPYVQVKNFAVLEKNKYINQPWQFALLVANNPAKLLAESYEILDENNEIFESLEYADGKILFHTGNTQYTVAFAKFRDVGGKHGKDFAFKAKIVYKAINSNDTFIYVIESKFNYQNQTWDLTSENSS